MHRYIAFLRGINVSGQKTMKMETLRKVTADAGFENVNTYIQSGNLLFDSAETNTKQLVLSIESIIEKAFGFDVEVIVRNLTDIESIVNSDFYNFMQSGDEKKFYITFLKDEYPGQLSLPIFSKNKEVEIYRREGSNLFSVCTLFKGAYSFPNAFIEKLTGIPATTRNPITLSKILNL